VRVGGGCERVAAVLGGLPDEQSAVGIDQSLRAVQAVHCLRSSVSSSTVALGHGPSPGAVCLATRCGLFAGLLVVWVGSGGGRGVGDRDPRKWRCSGRRFADLRQDLE